MNAIGQPHFTEPAAAYTVMESVDIRARPELLNPAEI
jgi:hypothetical protein